jgi:hypothetical protein
MAVPEAAASQDQDLKSSAGHFYLFLTYAAPAGAAAADGSSSLPPGPWFACCSSPGATNMTWLQAASSLPSEAVMRISTSSKEPTCKRKHAYTTHRSAHYPRVRPRLLPAAARH